MAIIVFVEKHLPRPTLVVLERLAAHETLAAILVSCRECDRVVVNIVYVNVDVLRASRAAEKGSRRWR